MAAGVANLRPLRMPNFYERLGETTDRLATGIRDVASDAGLPVTVNSCTGMLTVFFCPGPVATLTEAQAADTGRYARFFHAMLRRGFYVPPSQFEAWMISSRHTTDIVDATIQAVGEALREIAE
jgi:glutamate-1-semialdehyde 2,1-aminomutase